MDRSLTIPDVLYEKLEDSASRRGLKDFQQSNAMYGATPC